MLLPASMQGLHPVAGRLTAPEAGDAASGGLLFSGWCLGRDSPVVALVLRCGEAAFRFPVNLPSPGVARMYPSVPESDRCRFRFRLTLPPGTGGTAIMAFALGRDGQLLPFADIEVSSTLAAA